MDKEAAYAIKNDKHYKRSVVEKLQAFREILKFGAPEVGVEARDMLVAEAISLLCAQMVTLAEDQQLLREVVEANK